MKLNRLFITAIILLSSLFSYSVSAQTPDIMKDKPKELDKKKTKYGWSGMLKMAGTLSFANSKDVVGQTDGSTWNIGYLLSGNLIYLSKTGHEWKSDLGWQLNYLKTPMIEKFAKSIDNFELTSAYLYHLPMAKWTGPYAQLSLKTAIFKGYMITATDAQVDYQNSKGELIRSDNFLAQQAIDLTEAFSPTILKQSLGWFLNPIAKKHLNIFMQAGSGAWEIYGRDGWVLADNKDTAGILEVKHVDDTVQVGGELNFSAKGVIKKMFNYSVKANFMMPFYDNSDSTKSGMDLLNMQFEVKAGVKLNKYASIDYSFSALKLPLISDKWQIQNGLVLTVNIGLLGGKDKKKK